MFEEEKKCSGGGVPLKKNYYGVVWDLFCYEEDGPILNMSFYNGQNLKNKIWWNRYSQSLRYRAQAHLLDITLSKFVHLAK